jgi:hypothetical protein
MRSKYQSNNKKTATKAVIEKRWYAYAIAGAGAIAAAPQAHATIVFTSVNQQFTGTKILTGTSATQHLDGADTEGGFVLSTLVTGGSSGELFFAGTGTDPASILLHNHNAVLFTTGSTIGPAGIGQSYLSNQAQPVEVLPGAADLTSYMGLKFNLGGGGPNYGWVQLERNFNGTTSETVTIIGFAYEDQANVGIQAGSQSDNTPEPATAGLTLLGLGAAGFQAWRKRKQARQAA